MISFSGGDESWRAQKFPHKKHITVTYLNVISRYSMTYLLSCFDSITGRKNDVHTKITYHCIKDTVSPPERCDLVGVKLEKTS